MKSATGNGGAIQIAATGSTRENGVSDSRRHTSDRRGMKEGIGGLFRELLSGIPWSECAECNEESTYSAPSGKSIKVENQNGRTRVIGEDREDIVVRLVKRARAETNDAAQNLVGDIRVEANEANGTLSLEVAMPRKWNRHAQANLEVRVPRGHSINVSANNGKVCIEGIRSSVYARSSNGSVHIEDVVGDINITTSNAKVCCGCTCGNLSARSSNGKIELYDHKGSINASTSHALIRASVEAMGEDGVVLATSNGRIVLDLPDEADAEVDVRVDNGLIRTQRELTPRTTEAAGRLRGKLGSGGTPIKLRTSNASISLR